MIELKKINIAYFTAGNGIHFYRAEQPLESLRNKNYNVIKLPDPTIHIPTESEIDILNKVYPTIDIFFMSIPSPINFELIDSLKAIDSFKNYEGINTKSPKWVFDWDDDYFDINPMNVAYKNWGINEANFIINGEVLKPYRDKVDGFDIEINKERLIRLDSMMNLADNVFTTTPRLKEVHAKHVYNPDKIYCLPNAIDFDKYDYTKRVANDTKEVRFLWTVSDSHIIDWIKFKPVLGKFFDNHPDAKLVLFGSHMGVERFIKRSQFEHIPYVNNRDKYLETLHNTKADIGICPLIDIPFNWNKSPLKYQEFGSLKLPVVCSNVVYADTLTDGVNALIGEGLDGFYNKMCEAYDLFKNNKSKLNEIAENGYNHIKGKYSLDIVSSQYDYAFRNILGKADKFGGKQ